METCPRLKRDDNPPDKIIGTLAPKEPEPMSRKSKEKSKIGLAMIIVAFVLIGWLMFFVDVVLPDSESMSPWQIRWETAIFLWRTYPWLSLSVVLLFFTGQYLNNRS